MTRMSADQRRRQVLDAATVEFARAGFSGGSTQRIADEVGLSQPYLFQLFGSKLTLFIEVWNVCCDRVEGVLTQAVTELPHSERGPALAAAYDALLARDKNLLTIQLQAWSASCNNEEIRAAVAKRFNGMWDLVASIVSSRDLATTPDTVPPDTAPPDTVPPDTVPPDTAPPDTVTPTLMSSWVLYNVAAALQIDRVEECTLTGAWARTLPDG